ncbi:MAG: nuclear transport factor 2 family protein [Chloroflexi bacterium]|jgi:ketosteroid isomerase-like protein|nr:nuclear transport factor 2 family protein [Chloroflexota bacterium]
MRSTAEVIGHHIESMAAGDLNGLLSDYSDDAVVLTPNGNFSGPHEIKAFFEGFIASLPEGFVAAMELEVNVTSGEYGYMTWNAGQFTPLGTDTYHVVDGKFVMQSFAAYMPK